MQLMNSGTIQTGMRAPATGTVNAAHMATRSGRQATGYNKTAAVGGVINSNVSIAARPASRQGVVGTSAGTSAGAPTRQVYDGSYFLGELRNRVTAVVAETDRLSAETERVRRAATQSARLQQRVEGAREQVSALQSRFYDLNLLQRRSRDIPSETERLLRDDAARAVERARDLAATAESEYAARAAAEARVVALEAACAARTASADAAVRAQLGVDAANEFARLTAENAALREAEESGLAEIRTIATDLAAAERAARIDPARRRLAAALAASSDAHKMQATASAELAAAETALEKLRVEAAGNKDAPAAPVAGPTSSMATVAALSADDASRAMDLASKTLFDSLRKSAESGKAVETELRAKKTVIGTAAADAKEKAGTDKQAQLAARTREMNAFLRRVPGMIAQRKRELVDVKNSVSETATRFRAAAAAAEAAARAELAGGLEVDDADLEAELARATDELRRANDLHAAVDEERAELEARLSDLSREVAEAETAVQLAGQLSSATTPAQLAGMKTQLTAAAADIAQQLDEVTVTRRRIELEAQRTGGAFAAAADRYARAAACVERARQSIATASGLGIETQAAEMQAALDRLEAAVAESVASAQIY